MRDIKFRAWDEINKIMHYRFEFIRSGIETNDWIIFKSDKQTLKKDEVFNNPYFQQQLKIMQYTGLKDKNGIEIYEGDICEIEYSKESQREAFCKNGIGFIEYLDGSFWINNKYDKFSIIIDSSEKLKVIGNIYENPKLLEQ